VGEGGSVEIALALGGTGLRYSRYCDQTGTTCRVGSRYAQGGAHADIPLCGFISLGAALIAPAGMLARTNFQDDHHQDDKHRDRDDKNQKRYYDRDHKDYHNWDDRENRSYQQWTTENHRDNRDFSHLKRKEQSEYWNWRHNHPDDDRDRR
jgi:hypothetical protein